MPTPRRHVSLLANDADGTLVTPTKNKKQQASTITTCQRCECRLARDQTDHYCTPCQNHLSGTPPAILEYLDQ